MPQQKFSREENIKQVVKFVLFSCSAGIIETITFTVLNEFVKLSYWPAYLPALVLSVLWNFTLNRNYTFKSAANIPVAMFKVFLYYCVFTPVSTVLGDYFADTVGVNEYIVLFVTMVLNLATEFLFCRFVVYRNSIGTKKVKKQKSEEV
jgi:putative flippase GtrA